MGTLIQWVFGRFLSEPAGFEHLVKSFNPVAQLTHWLRIFVTLVTINQNFGNKFNKNGRLLPLLY